MKKRFFVFVISMMMGSSLSFINVSSVAATEKINAPKVTTAPKQTTKSVTTTAAPAQPSQPNVTHVHQWTKSTVNETINHPAEYGTRTYWYYSPVYMEGKGNDLMDLNKIAPYRINLDWNSANNGYAEFYGCTYVMNDYDLFAYYYGEPDNIPKDCINYWITDGSIDPTMYNIGWEDHDWYEYTSYGDWNYDVKFHFNPETDVLFATNWSKACHLYDQYRAEHGISGFGLHDTSTDFEGEYVPIYQKTILVKNAWTETISHTSYQCSCGEVMDGETISYIEGDVNGDGEVTIADAVALQKWLLGNDVEMPHWQAGDLVCDEEINVFDLCMLKRKLINNN